MGYIIEEIKYGYTEGGVCCGPVDGLSIVSFKFNDGNTTKWLTNADFVGFPRFYLTDKDIFDELMKQDFDNEEFEEFLDKNHIETFSNIKLNEYEDIDETLDKADKSSANLIKAIALFSQGYDGDKDYMIPRITGKNIAEVDLSEFEEVYYDYF